jgi:hypothetical protein
MTKANSGPLKMFPGAPSCCVDEDEQAREHEASDALEDNEQIAPRLVFREEKCEVRDRRVSAPGVDLSFLYLLF